MHLQTDVHLGDPLTHVPVRRSRAKERPPRHTDTIIAELRGLAGLSLEQGLLSPGSVPLASLVDWQRRLIMELGSAPPARPRNYTEMIRQIAGACKDARGETLIAA